VAVRSALLKIPGVTRAQVSLQTHEAIVTYDPALVAVDALVTAVNETEGPSGTLMYRATVKTSPSPSSAQ
jgi:copper chaperone CopZ